MMDAPKSNLRLSITQTRCENLNVCDTLNDSKAMLFLRILFCCLYFMVVYLMLPCLFPCSLLSTYLKRADLLALDCVVLSCFCHFPIWRPGSDVVLDCIDS